MIFGKLLFNDLKTWYEGPFEEQKGSGKGEMMTAEGDRNGTS